MDVEEFSGRNEIRHRPSELSTNSLARGSRRDMQCSSKVTKLQPLLKQQHLYGHADSFISRVGVNEASFTGLLINLSHEQDGA